jgi:hypothetical protein
MGATAGDLLARDVVREWLDEAGVAHDVALTSPFEGGVDWRSVDPKAYDCVIFVCGPFGDGWPLQDFLRRFAGSKLIGMNLSMLDPVERWNPFDVLIERDSSRGAHPDLCFLARPAPAPVVGLVLVDPQPEYKHRGLHQRANEAIDRLLAAREVAVVRIDTRLDSNCGPLRSPAEVESLIARMELVVTTRLHGMVLALKNGVPALAVDPIAGGAKIVRQARTIGWPLAFAIDGVSDHALAAALDYGLSEDGRAAARACAGRARGMLGIVRDDFLTAVREP